MIADPTRSEEFDNICFRLWSPPDGALLAGWHTHICMQEQPHMIHQCSECGAQNIQEN